MNTFEPPSRPGPAAATATTTTTTTTSAVATPTTTETRAGPGQPPAAEQPGSARATADKLHKIRPVLEQVSCIEKIPTGMLFHAVTALSDQACMQTALPTGTEDLY